MLSVCLIFELGGNGVCDHPLGAGALTLGPARGVRSTLKPMPCWFTIEVGELVVKGEPEDAEALGAFPPPLEARQIDRHRVEVPEVVSHDAAAFWR
jgi:hypothetical protein